MPRLSEVTNPSQVWLSLFRSAISLFEFSARVVLVNIPLYLIAKSPELDRVCSIAFAYLNFQVVGFCYAFLTNALFAMACNALYYLPPLSISTILGTDTEVDNRTGRHHYLTSTEMISAFYISYASIRVVLTFAVNVFNIALESIKDFPDAAKVLSKEKMKTLQLYPLMFMPGLMLQFALFTAEDICYPDHNYFGNQYMEKFCEISGMVYLTAGYPEIRRLVLIVSVVVVIQLWQTFLYQFPSWNTALRKISGYKRAIFQIVVFCLVFVSCVSLAMIFVYNSQMTGSICKIICGCMIGWTLWLYFFIPRLIDNHGASWAIRVTPVYLEHLAAYLRLSHLIAFFFIWSTLCFYKGFFSAQLDLTVATLVMPALYSSAYLVLSTFLQAGSKLVTICIPISFALSYFITTYMARSSGRGSIILVFIHILSKLIHFFGHEIASDDDDHTWNEHAHMDTTSLPDSSGTRINNANGIATSSYDHYDLISSSDRLDTDSTKRLDSSNNSNNAFSDNLMNIGLSPSATSTDALNKLNSRGQEHSSLVKMVPDRTKRHWLVRANRRNVFFFGNLAKSIAMPSSTMNGIIKVFTAIAILIAIFLSICSIASFLQQNFNIFPKLIDFIVEKDINGDVLSYRFDHRISNVTLYTSSSRPRNSDIHTCGLSKGNTSSSISSGLSNSLNGGECTLMGYEEKMKYASCGIKWKDLSLLDFALISEMSYIDDDNGSLQGIADNLLPRHNFKVLTSDSRGTRGPVFIELHSSVSNVTIVAIRGTDVGRIQDFIEDVKLYAEPVIFKMLSTIFPTISLWTGETTSRVIETLYEFNSFFGLQGEAEYYRSLTQRILEIHSSNTLYKHEIIITGHSMGGGLARIVGTLTDNPTVTFNPPGLALSYRKYSASLSDGSVIKIRHRTSMHQKSLAVITEYDFITQIDHQVGLIQNIVCDKVEFAHVNACHFLEGTICHLLQHCGDDQERFVDCQYDYNIMAIFPGLWSMFLSRKWIILPICSLIALSIALAIIPEIV